MQTAQSDRWTLGAKPKRAKPKPRLLVYGEPGIGKTSFGARAPGAVLVPTEDGALALDVPRFPAEGKCETWEDVLRATRAIAEEDHGFEYYVLDTLNEAEHLCAVFVCRRDFGGVWNTTKGVEGFNAFGKGDKAVAQEMRQLLELLDRIQRRGMGVIMLAHVGLHRQANALGMDFQKFGAEMNKNSWALVCSWADQVGFACRKMRSAQREGEKVAKVTPIGSERWLVFEGGPAIDAKSRAGYEMPAEILLSWDEYAKQSLADRVGELVDQVIDLLPTVPEGAQAKVAKRLGGEATAEKLRELGKAKLEATINWLLSLQASSGNKEAA